MLSKRGLDEFWGMVGMLSRVWGGDTNQDQDLY